MEGNPILGHHVILELFECQCPIDMLARVSHGHDLMMRCSEFLTRLNISAHQFQPDSYSVMVMLAESHLSIHTWTQHRYAAMDFYTCTGSVPEQCVQIACEALRPKRIVRVDIQRGTTNPITRTETDFHAGAPSPKLD